MEIRLQVNEKGFYTVKKAEVVKLETKESKKKTKKRNGS